MKNIVKRLFVAFLDLLRLRFPPKYRFIVLTSHGNGHNALWIFLQKCDVRLIRIFMLRSDYAQFCLEIFKNLWTLSKNQCMALSFDSINFEKEEKIYTKITKQVPVLLLVRDPISVLCSHINLYRFWNHIATLDENGVLQLPKEPYCLGYDTEHREMNATDRPDVRAIHLWAALVDGDYTQVGNFDYVRESDKQRKLACICTYTSGFEALKDKISELTIIDMSAILPENAFATMTRLAQQFGFAPPLKQNRAFYEAKLYGRESLIYPIVLHVGALFGRAASTTNHVVFTHNVAGEGGGQDLLIYSNAQRLEYFGFGDAVPVDFFANKSKGAPRWYCKACAMQSFVKLDEARISMVAEAMRQVETWCGLQQQNMANHKVNEEELLAYLAANPALFARLAKALETETSIVRERAPEIFAQWHYYAQFLARFCAQGQGA